MDNVLIIKLLQKADQPPVIPRPGSINRPGEDHHIDHTTGNGCRLDIAVQHRVDDVDPGVVGDVGRVFEAERAAQSDDQRAQSAVGRAADGDLFGAVPGDHFAAFGVQIVMDGAVEIAEKVANLPIFTHLEIRTADIKKQMVTHSMIPISRIIFSTTRSPSRRETRERS